MKKRPIDDIFRDKLNGHTTEPSAQAWQKLSSKVGSSKTRGIAYYWYVAASLLIGALLLYQNQPDHGGSQERPALSVVKAPPTEIPKPTAPSILPSDAPEPVEQRRQVQAHKKPQPALESLQSLAGAPSAPRKLVSPVETGKVRANEPDASPSLLERSTLPTMGAEPELAMAAVPAVVEVKESRVILVKVEEPEVLGNEKSGKFSRLFQQLKNVKSGDPVDWEQVGLNPKALLARVDERLVGNEGNHSGRMRKSKALEPTE